MLSSLPLLSGEIDVFPCEQRWRPVSSGLKGGWSEAEACTQSLREASEWAGSSAGGVDGHGMLVLCLECCLFPKLQLTSTPATRVLCKDVIFHSSNTIKQKNKKTKKQKNKKTKKQKNKKTKKKQNKKNK